MTAMSEETPATRNSDGRNGIRVIIVFSQGQVLSSSTTSIADRPVLHVPIQVKYSRIPAVITTLATGVGVSIHGVVTNVTIDPQTLQRRPFNHEDCLYPCFWTDAAAKGLRTTLLDWAGSDEDPLLPDSVSPKEYARRTKEYDVDDTFLCKVLGNSYDSEQMKSSIRILARMQLVLGEAHDRLEHPDQPDLLGVYLRLPQQLTRTKGLQEHLDEQIKKLVERSLDSSIVFVVHTRQDDAAKNSAEQAWVLSIIGGDHESGHLEGEIDLRSIGSAIRLFSGVQCPPGTRIPGWRFMKLPCISGEAEFIPTGLREDQVDWNNLVDRVLEMPEGDSETGDRKQNIQVLSRRFNELSLEAFRRYQWQDLERCARILLRIRHLPVDHWWNIFALDRLSRHEDLVLAVDSLVQEYPKLPVTHVARALIAIQHDTDGAAALLNKLDPDELRINTSLGTLGRLCLKAGLEEKGLAAISRAIRGQMAIQDDRMNAAQYLLQAGRADEAMAFMGNVGMDLSNRGQGVLRLRILLALGQQNVVDKYATAFLERYPGDRVVLDLIQG